jgi:hypothetical protein
MDGGAVHPALSFFPSAKFPPLDDDEIVKVLKGTTD